MLSRLLPKPSQFRFITHLSSKSHHYLQPQNSYCLSVPRFLSTGNDGNNNNNNGNRDQSTSNVWKHSRESDGNFDHLFSKDAENLEGIADTDSPADDSWLRSKGGESSTEADIFEGIEKEAVEKSGGIGDNEWATMSGYEPWSLVEEEKDDVFDIEESIQAVGETRPQIEDLETDNSEEAKMLEKEELELTAILKGPNRAFGDLISASGITDEMLDSLIALKDLEGVEGLPPLREIEDMRYEKNTRKSSRAEIERQKQEEVAKARVRQVDDKGRAYGTGRRKCSIARVWIQPGDGKFMVNDKEIDVYFPMLDNRAALLRPFSETKTLGLWDVDCTVKGGGVSGQVGAIQLGISRALQNWEPDMRPPLRAVGFLTRDSRVVERKKPGKAKARKSFQWVKR